MQKCLIASALALACVAQATAQTLRDEAPPANGVWVDSLDLSKLKQEWGKVQAGHSVGTGPLSLHGQVYKHGIGTHASSDLLIDLKGAATRFLADVGIDDDKKGFGSVRFHVVVDGKEAAGTAVLHGGDESASLSVDLTGAKLLQLSIDDADDGIEHDHADWGGAVLILKPGAKENPVAIDLPPPPLPIIGGPVVHTPAIHNPHITGATPGRPFLFLIPATGDGPLTYQASNLPAGLTLDEKTGIISGALQSPGVTAVGLTVKGSAGVGSATLTIVGGEHKLALTPPMGWNSWNVWFETVDAAKVRAAADAMAKSQLAAHGFQYVNIDDTWEAKRDANGEITSNAKFGDMKALADYIHSKGLKFGVYSSPGEQTCAGFEGSYGHEVQDAKTYGLWGVDYLKYDWCSYGNHAKDKTLPELKKPYIVMRSALDQSPRDIVYSLCQYGDGDVWKWGQEVGGNTWRTTGDIRDSWGSMVANGFSQDGHEKFAGPGHWNDPDMLIVGKLGGATLHDTHLTPYEQVSHITLWSLQAAPLLIGCDMSQIDPFTLALLTNDEVLDIDQDRLGAPAGRTSKEFEVWSRPLADGTHAVGLFNLKSNPAEVVASWKDIGIEGEQPVRDLWQQKDLGSFNGSYKVTIPRHGAVLIKVGTPKKLP